MIYIKRICNNYTELIQFLADCGFTTEVNGNYYYTPMYNDRGTADVTKMPYYDINTSGEGVLMLHGDEVFEGFNTSDGPVGCIAAKLIRNGIAICISQLANDATTDQVTFCCENNYTYEDPTDPTSEIIPKGNPMNNSLLVLTPEANTWYAGWRDEKKYTDENPDEFQWNTYNIKTENTSYGIEANSFAVLYQNFFGVSLTKMLLTDLQDVAKNNYIFTAGKISKPGCTFKVNGKDFVAFTDNSNYRCPAFQLQSPPLTQNDSMSTSLYEETKLYNVGDYCIYDDLLWKCTTAITVPMAFDDNYWTITTVLNEILNYEE